MAKKAQAGVSIRMNRDGSMNIRSHGGVDLRKVLPHLFQPRQEAENPDQDAAIMPKEGR